PGARAAARFDRWTRRSSSALGSTRRREPRLASIAASERPKRDCRFELPSIQPRTLPQRVKLPQRFIDTPAGLRYGPSRRRAHVGLPADRLEGKTSMNRMTVGPMVGGGAMLLCCGPQGSGGMDPFQVNAKKAPLNPQGSLVDVLPDMQPWSYEETATFGLAYAYANDRLVSCDDWTQISPDLITGQRIITFQLG